MGCPKRNTNYFAQKQLRRLDKKFNQRKEFLCNLKINKNAAFASLLFSIDKWKAQRLNTYALKYGRQKNSYHF